jgi:enamine deaminase RidA (YjgF/YER057c/UK114 family)
MSKTFINPPTLFSSAQYGFSQVVISKPTGSLFHTSGQVAMDNYENVVGNTLSDQARQSLQNLSHVMTAIGGSMSDIMSLRIYFVHTEFDNIHVISEALKEFFDEKQLPASTWIGVTTLARKEFLIEIEAMGSIV